jgi:hypothetical protein
MAHDNDWLARAVAQQKSFENVFGTGIAEAIGNELKRLGSHKEIPTSTVTQEEMHELERYALLGNLLNNKLYRGLRDIVRLPNSITNSTLKLKEQRYRQIHALMHLANFLRQTRAGDDVARLFGDLANALFGLDIGIPHPMLFDTFNWKGRHHDRSDVTNLRVIAGCGVEYLLRGEITRREIKQRERRYSNDFPGLKILKRRGKSGPGKAEPDGRKEASEITLGSSLLRWRDAVMYDATGTPKGIQYPVAAGRARYFREIVLGDPALSLHEKDLVTQKRLRELFIQHGEFLLQSASDQAAQLPQSPKNKKTWPAKHGYRLTRSQMVRVREWIKNRYSEKK